LYVLPKKFIQFPLAQNLCDCILARLYQFLASKWMQLMFVLLVLVRSIKQHLGETHAVTPAMHIFMHLVANDANDLHASEVDLKDVDLGNWKWACKFSKQCLLELSSTHSAFVVAKS
jgi:hypothetical protein